MPILTTRGVAPLVVAMLLVAGCSIKPASSDGNLDLRTGCSWVVAERSIIGAQVVMDVRATDCRDPNGLPLERDLALDRVAQAVWESLELPVDAVRVRLSGAEASHDDALTTITDGDLTERFGRGPPGVVWPVTDRSDESIWVVLPVAYLAAGLAMLLLVRRLRSAGLIVVLVRR